MAETIVDVLPHSNLWEPCTYPAALPLVAAATALLGGSTIWILSDAIVLRRWAGGPVVQPGLGIWYEGRIVLLATEAQEVWAYRPGAVWQDALYQALAQLPPGVPPEGFVYCGYCGVISCAAEQVHADVCPQCGYVGRMSHHVSA